MLFPLEPLYLVDPIMNHTKSSLGIPIIESHHTLGGIILTIVGIGRIRGVAAQGLMAGVGAALAAGGSAAEVALARTRAWDGRSVGEPGRKCFT